MTESETTQLNRDMVRLCELQDEHKAVAAFIYTVLSRLNDPKKHFCYVRTTFITTYWTDLASATEKLPKVAVVRWVQEETAGGHAKRLSNMRSHLQASRLDQVTPRSPQPQTVGQSTFGPRHPSSCRA